MKKEPKTYKKTYNIYDSVGTLIRKANHNDALKRKKYQLKLNDGTELKVIAEFDNMFEILFYIKFQLTPRQKLTSCSLWVNGKVLD